MSLMSLLSEGGALSRGRDTRFTVGSPDSRVEKRGLMSEQAFPAP